ncbi:MAG: hypothetical protein ACJZ47_04035 [bacterium]
MKINNPFKAIFLSFFLLFLFACTTEKIVVVYKKPIQKPPVEKLDLDFKSVTIDQLSDALQFIQDVDLFSKTYTGKGLDILKVTRLLSKLQPLHKGIWNSSMHQSYARLKSFMFTYKEFAIFHEKEKRIRKARRLKKIVTLKNILNQKINFY